MFDRFFQTFLEIIEQSRSLSLTSLFVSARVVGYMRLLVFFDTLFAVSRFAEWFVGGVVEIITGFDCATLDTD